MEQQSEETKKRRISLKGISGIQKIAAVGLVILIVVFAYALMKNRSVYTSYEVVNTLSRGDNTSVYYQMMNKGMLRYSKDGVAMTDKDGNLEWNQTFEMTSPALAVKGQYVAIGDIGANSIYVFNEYGQIGRVTTDVPLQEIKISGQGVTAAILSDAESNYINLYDRQGKELGSIKASLENTGYPLAIGLSQDATKLAASYLCIDGAVVRTRVIFYDFGDIEGDHVIENQLLEGLYPKVEFLSDERVAFYGENGFSLFNIGGSVEMIQNTVFEDEIRSVFAGSQKMGFIFKNQSDQGKYRMDIYDVAGKKNTTIYFDFDYEKAVVDDDIILYNEQEIMIYQYGGRLRFHSKLDGSITGVMESWEEGMYWLIDDQLLQEIRIE